MYKLLFLVLLTTGLSADYLTLLNGYIKAHTEVIGDNEIDPFSNKVGSRLTIQDSVESIKGKIFVGVHTFRNITDDRPTQRDEEMHEVLNVINYPVISFNIQEVVKSENSNENNLKDSSQNAAIIDVYKQEVIKESYKIRGILNVNGVEKEVSSEATIIDNVYGLNMTGNFSFLLSDFNMEPPSLAFFTIRDQIDIKYNLTYQKD